MHFFSLVFLRLRDEKVDERGIARDHKLRDLSSQNGNTMIMYVTQNKI